MQAPPKGDGLADFMQVFILATLCKLPLSYGRVPCPPGLLEVCRSLVTHTGIRPQGLPGQGHGKSAVRDWGCCWLPEPGQIFLNAAVSGEW